MLLSLNHAPSQHLFRKNKVAHLCFIAFLNRIKHIILDCVLTLEFENKAVLEFKCLFFRNARLHLQLSVRFLNLLADVFVALWWNHKRLLQLALFRFLINRIVITYGIFLSLQKFLELLIIVGAQRYHNSCFSVIFSFALYVFILRLLKSNHLEVFWRI